MAEPPKDEMPRCGAGDAQPEVERIARRRSSKGIHEHPACKAPAESAAMPPNTVTMMGMLRFTTSFGVFQAKLGDAASTDRAIVMSR